MYMSKKQNDKYGKSINVEKLGLQEEIQRCINKSAYK